MKKKGLRQKFYLPLLMVVFLYGCAVLGPDRDGGGNSVGETTQGIYTMGVTNFTLLSDDFSGNLSRWVNTNGASISGGQLTVTNNENAMLLSSGGSNWTDYAFEADVKALSSSPAGIIFRCRDNNNCYMWQFYFDGKQGWLQPHKKIGGNWNWIKSVTISSPAVNTMYHIKIEAVGSTIKTYLNGTLVDTTVDSTFSSGKVGFREYTTESGVFDNVKVSAVYIFADGNIRSDVQAKIDQKYSSDPVSKSLAEENARAMEQFIDAVTQEEAMSAFQAISQASWDIYKKLPNPGDYAKRLQISRDVEAWTVNSYDRLTRYLELSELVSGAYLPQPLLTR